MTPIDSGATAWLLVSTALVMLMTPGLALFYGGLVQGKNVLSTFMHCFFALGIVTIQWVVIGYSLSFAPSLGGSGLIGGLDFAFMSGVGMAPPEGKAIPHLLFMMFQGMFAIITPALIAGAYAERLKFSAYCLFTLLWATLVYDPLAHWVWGPGGWLAGLGALDFAGGTVVHLSSGVSALVVAIVLGKRLGYPRERKPPHDLTMTLLGAGLLWFGWFGFNAGSALAADGSASLALVNTHIAAAAGAVAWGVVEALRSGKASALGIASGLVAGLVVVTPAAGYIGPMAAIALGVAAGVVCYAAVLLKSKAGYDDALDAFGVHGVGGATGALLTGVFAQAAFTKGPGGLIEGESKLFIANLAGVAAAAAYAAIVTFVILKVVKALVGLRVDEETEHDGLDQALHGEAAYHGDATTGAVTTVSAERDGHAPAQVESPAGA